MRIKRMVIMVCGFTFFLIAMDILGWIDGNPKMGYTSPRTFIEYVAMVKGNPLRFIMIKMLGGVIGGIGLFFGFGFWKKDA